ncbi:putative histone-lysine N-methyltransferase ATXR3 [Dorcoceras hygrometricum]|uniref:Putative histone-lysine N-methyltransferase ATXR3 n=1 Tax=Dorcoceras hygrometricum TaxID=472368 RepID=A0A2Z7BI11_9LAMI|nr:putative histone-lysine N-methyltransferase ATXR3 [Dorcoceras hygrometricum]
MVTPDSRQAKGYAIQICVLLKNIPGLELGESKAFPAPRILNEKSVHRIVSVNENVGEVGDAPRAKPTPVKRTVSKKRQASIDADVAPIIKKKRTTKIKPVAAKKLVLEETIAAIPLTEELLPVKEITFEDADATIRQVLSQLDMVCEPQDDVQRGRDETWFDRAFDEAFVAENQEDQASVSLEHIFLKLDAAGIKEVGDSSKQSAASKHSVEEIMSVDDLLVQICDDLKLPSITAAEISKIKVGEPIAMRDKGKGILVENEIIQSNPAQEAVDIICGDIEFLVELRDRVMVDVVEFFHSFSLNKLTDLDALLALKAKEKLMLEWAETDSLETAVKRRLFILSRYREMLLRTLLDSHRHYLVTGQPWTATASQTFDLLSAVHSESLDALRNQQQEHGIFLEQPCSSTAVDYAEDCGTVFARFFSVARSTCWVRPLICLDGIWTPLQGPDFWRSGSKLSLVLNKVEMSVPAVHDIFGHSVSFIEPTQYWEAAPFLHKTWAWHCVCTEVFPFTLSGRLRQANRSTDIVMYSLDVQKLPAYLIDDFQRGLHTDCFASYFGSSDALSDSATFKTDEEYWIWLIKSFQAQVKIDSN